MQAKPATSSTEEVFLSENTTDILKRLKDGAEKDQLVNKNVKQLQFNAIKEKLGLKKNIDSKAATLLESLSIVATGAKKQMNFVAPGENITVKHTAHLQTAVDKIAATSKRTVTVSLTEEALTKLKTINPGLQNIPASDFEAVAYDRVEGVGPTLTNQLPFLNECSDGTYVKCLEVLGIADPDKKDTTTAVTEDQVATSVVTATSEAILRKITDLISSLSSPEFSPVLAIAPRAKTQDIQDQVNGFNIAGGPADQTAFYDFYSLQIAFEHVWQEVFDSRLLTLIHDIYGLIVDSGVPQSELEHFENADDFLQYAKTVLQATEAPHPAILKYFNISAKQWKGLYNEHKTELLKIATGVQYIQDNTRINSSQAADLVKSGQRIINNSGSNQLATWSPPEDILQELKNRLNENYSFTVFAADKKNRSVNFGILLNYRQKWEPLGYQAGELIATKALAPGEKRKFSKKLVTKRSLSQKESTSTSVKRSSELSDTVRAEDEIVKKAMSKTNFTYALKTNVDVTIEGVATVGGDTSYSYGKDTAAESADTRKDFREAIVKSAEDYKNDHSLEINTSESIDFEAEESGEIANPNDELTVTYLFFELQRIFRINEQLHRITPVILVAQEVPNPAAINRAWVIAHDWIIHRVILDETFIPALNYLSTRIVGDAASLAELKTHLENQRGLVNELKISFSQYQQLTEDRYTALQDAVDKRAASTGGGGGGLFGSVTSFMFGGGSGNAEGARIIEEAAQETYNKAIQDEKESRARLEREVSNLQSITDSYTKALSDHLNQDTQIERLLLHIKMNIFYYMQAIWLHEPADERFFRLQQVQVPDLTGERHYSLTGNALTGTYPDWHTPLYTFEVSCSLSKDFKRKSLVEVADLDNLIGFKGNYMVFPLKDSNEITDYMMAPYISKSSGIADPDPAADWSLQQYFNYICCIKKKIDNGTLPQETFNSYKPALLELYEKLITSPFRQNDELIIPTGSLFIEALTGAHPILENFKLMHRALDVKKVQAETRYAELENLRVAERLIDKQLEDPSIEKKIVIENGNENNIVLPGE